MALDRPSGPGTKVDFMLHRTAAVAAPKARTFLVVRTMALTSDLTKRKRINLAAQLFDKLKQYLYFKSVSGLKDYRSSSRSNNL